MESMRWVFYANKLLTLLLLLIGDSYIFAIAQIEILDVYLYWR